jgi:hypothetical protein
LLDKLEDYRKEFEKMSKSCVKKLVEFGFEEPEIKELDVIIEDDEDKE